MVSAERKEEANKKEVSSKLDNFSNLSNKQKKYFFFKTLKWSP